MGSWLTGKSACSSNGGREEAVPSVVLRANLNAWMVAVLTPLTCRENCCCVSDYGASFGLQCLTDERKLGFLRGT